MNFAEALNFDDFDHPFGTLLITTQVANAVPWIIIIYMFYVQAKVCDDYFVPALSAYVAKYQIPEHVAGATLMALGANGPELFSNLVATLFYPEDSDIGSGTIIGSEIFNLLAIVGGAALVSPTVLVLEKAVFLRDCFFYGLSVVLLGWVLNDGLVTLKESLILVASGSVFVLTVVYWDRLVTFIKGSEEKSGYLLGSPRSQRSRHLVYSHNFGKSFEDPSQVEVIVYTPNRMHTSGFQESVPMFLNPIPEELAVEFVMSSKDEPAFGDLVQSPCPPHSPMASPTNIRVISPESPRRAQTSFFFQSTAEDPCLSQIRKTEIMSVEHFDETGETVLKVLSEGGDLLSVQIYSTMSLRGTFGEEYEDSGPEEALRIFGERMRLPEVSWYKKLYFLLTFPVDFLLTLVMYKFDCKSPSKRDYWLYSFILCIGCLAVASTLMVAQTSKIHEIYGISNAKLGITIGAIGTSFPNFLASIIMARQGRSSMAVANALGSNIQNVFFALAIPWLIKNWIDRPKPLQMASPDIYRGIAWMLGTLIFVVLAGFIYKFGFTKPFGQVLIGLYVTYLSLQLI